MGTLSEVRERLAPVVLPTLAEISGQIDSSEELVRHRLSRISRLRSTSLRVHSALTPRVDRLCKAALHALDIGLDEIDFYIFSDVNINGFCYLIGSPVSIGISSGAVNNLSDEELVFVIGHEIGHAIFGDISVALADDDSLETARLSRYVELTADRIGILACQDVNPALKAMVKTVSGLEDDELRFDFAHYSQELRSVQKIVSHSFDPSSTHPPFSIRFRAALAFSNIFTSTDWIPSRGRLDLPLIKKANTMVIRSLNESCDKFAAEKISSVISDVILWFSCTLNPESTAALRKNIFEGAGVSLSDDDVKRAVNFLESYSGEERRDLLMKKIKDAIQAAKAIAPRQLSWTLTQVRVAYGDNQFFQIAIRHALN